MRFRLLFLSGLLLFTCVSTEAQERLSYTDFMVWVRDYHPVARQADLTLDLGRQELRAARGAFDPLVFGNMDQKQFKGTEYYNTQEAGLLLPTLAGVELQGLVERNTGDFLNSENVVPESGLFAIGAAVNLGKGLFIDERRASLQQAKIFALSTEMERIQVLNDLYLEAVKAYWKWAGSYANLEVRREGLKLASIRFEGIVSSFEQGDLPAIDTVEAYTQVLSRTIQLQKAENSFFASTQDLNVFLWDMDQNPIYLDPEVIPQELQEYFPSGINREVFRELVARHPELRLLDYDLDHLEIERRYKAEQLKPTVKLKYNFLTENLGGMEGIGFMENDYKFGVEIATPLFLRKARGGLGLTRTKISMVGNKRDLKSQQLRAKLEQGFNDYQVLNQQIATFRDNISGLERLLEGERVKFDLGESSLFLINARETSLFDALLVNNSLFVDKNIAFSKVRTAAGLGFEGVNP
ncbi:Outer membrane protein TolC [Cyclobacterium xiamenense]|uniref:Outer membrane protein TolC n=1 Tax=Cyclobacterium xiamenense TaxID=1297121 RepID=A0A1H6Z1J4_9BACT|nr:TolC family protein [Cyclobacterium xiamenense]SEJ46536.1 Outer membrane protein TolC [Cyclobacterium xiamenense]